LERSDDSTIPYLLANLIYTGALVNSNEELQLFDSNCNLIDKVAADPDWPAGNNDLKLTMERGNDLS